LLPYIEQHSLWQQSESAFQLAPTAGVWDEPQVAILGMPVGLFACPSDPRAAVQIPFDNGVPVAFTSYLGISGHRPFRDSGVLFPDSAVKFTDITDGTSNTLLLGERPPSADFHYGWWYRATGQTDDGSGEMILTVRDTNRSPGYACPTGPYRFVPDRFDNPCAMFHFWSPHTGGANFAFADGSVRFLSYSADDVMPALATRAGGETVSIPD
jgi:prepilin-type processing-associated H-X9-DG protein